MVKKWIMSVKFRLIRSFYYLFLTVVAIMTAFPFYWMLVTSFKTPQELSEYPPTIVPDSFNLDNYQKVVNTANFVVFFRNSIIVTVVGVVLMFGVVLLAAYGFYKYWPTSKRKYIRFFLLTNSIPFEVLMIYNYKMIVSCGINNTLVALIVPFLYNFSYVYIVYLAFNSIPKDLVSAAYTDKTSNFKFMFRIAIPYIKPTLIYLIIMYCVSSWNSFVWPMLVSTSAQSRTLPLALYTYMPEYGSRIGPLMAMSMLSEIPMLFLFVFFQKSILMKKNTSKI